MAAARILRKERPAKIFGPSRLEATQQHGGKLADEQATGSHLFRGANDVQVAKVAAPCQSGDLSELSVLLDGEGGQ